MTILEQHLPHVEICRVGWRRGDGTDPGELLRREWLVANGLGGYASGTIIGASTRRYHGLLVAALPNPLGRTMMFNHLSEQLRLPDGTHVRLGAHEHESRLDLSGADHLEEFRLEMGLPVWTYAVAGRVIEKRVFLAHQQNTVHVTYRLLEGDTLRLSLRPTVHFQSHDAPVSLELGPPYGVSLRGDRFELTADGNLPPLRLRPSGRNVAFVSENLRHETIIYRAEADRGYQARGELWSPGYFKMVLTREAPAALIASTEAWETLGVLSPEQALRYELERRTRLVHIAPGAATDETTAELVLAADQFLIAPAGRIEDATRARAEGEELRTVIAGYHWFTDWGRDTMISLEGLALSTGRKLEARWILHSFAHYVREGLIPNLFPEGSQLGLYHTADATLWFFHAVDRYLQRTQDRNTLQTLLPVLEDIVEWHRRGTQFGIHVDPEDGLLTQGQDGYALTWMDAKCDGWVVTPRRGKAVEINALWYNALRLLERWVGQERGGGEAAALGVRAARVQQSFNARFWNAGGGHLYDVVDTTDGTNDAAFRPNQIFAVSLPNPVLQEDRWRAVVDAVAERLLTPVGLRTLARDHADYKPNYHGDLRTRDAAYHQGTVWSWLLGPFIDAWLKVHPDGAAPARGLLRGLQAHLGDACIGSVSEVFDAEPPFTPRGCVAQAWSVAEFLRAWVLTRPRPS